MKHATERQIQIMRLALNLSGLSRNDAGAETVLMVHDELERIGGKFSLKEATAIERYIRDKYYTRKIEFKKKKKT
jgi:hypothetical protein